MSKKILIMFLAIVAGAFMASVAMAENYGDLANNHLSDEGFQFAGTILNPEGKGDVLIAPYYDVRAINGKAQDTYFAIINENMEGDTHRGVAAKLRFREWDKSEEVFDIDIWLSDNDVWVGVLTRNPNNGLTTIISPDYVIIDSSTTTFTVSKTTTVSTGFDFFTDFAPGGAFNEISPPSGFTSADLTNMGYFEIIGEERTFTKPSTTTAPILVTRFTEGWDCPNSLSAYVYIVRVVDGVSLGYNATAIANFSRQEVSKLFVGPGDVRPDLAEDAEDGLDQLEFELSKAQVYQGYSIEDSIAAQFSMIVTFPTKHFHFNKTSPVRLDYDLLIPPFGAPFTGETANFGEVITPTIFDRNENPFKPESGFWSPRTTPTISLPFEVNVIGLYKGTPPSVPLIGNRNNVAFSTGGFQSGWMWIDLFVEANTTLAHFAVPIDKPVWGHFGLDFTRYNGMPAIGLALQEFSNTSVGGAYGTIFPAFYQVDWIEEPEI